MLLILQNFSYEFFLIFVWNNVSKKFHTLGEELTIQKEEEDDFWIPCCMAMINSSNIFHLQLHLSESEKNDLFSSHY